MHRLCEFCGILSSQSVQSSDIQALGPPLGLAVLGRCFQPSCFLLKPPLNVQRRMSWPPQTATRTRAGGVHRSPALNADGQSFPSRMIHYHAHALTNPCIV